MNIALGVEYDGGRFHGFQSQHNAASVQDALQAALSQIAATPVQVAAAGRTDAGVHATGQVVSFTSPVQRPVSAWIRGSNALTPAALKVRWARQVDAAFHARFSAAARRYQYLFHESPTPSPLLTGYALSVAGRLDEDAMHRAAQVLVGEHDFSAFRGARCQAATAYRCIHRITVQRAASLVVVDVTANAFLLHMVRNVAGALLRVGQDRAEPAWLATMLAGRDRTRLGPTAPPQGLYLVDVHYPGRALPPGAPPALLRALGGLDRF